MANRAVAIGLWSVLVIVIAAIGILAYLKISNHAGDKIWEYSDPVEYFSFSIKPDSNSAFLLSSGKLQVVNALTGRPEWNAKLPEKTGYMKTLIVDDDRCLLHSRKKVMLCSSAQAAPAWEYAPPQPTMSAQPIILDNRLYLASASKKSYISYFGEDSDYFDEDYGYSEEAFNEFRNEFAESSKNRDSKPDKEAKKLSTISAIDIASGAELWKTDLEDREVGGLMADGGRVYAIAYDFTDDARRRNRLRARSGDAGGEEQPEEDEEAGSAQLWALDAATGKPKWKLEGVGDFAVPPMMSAEGVVFSTERNIYLITPNGQVKWNYPLTGKYIRSFQPHENKLFVSTGDGFLFCLDLLTGQKKWMTEIGGDPGRIVVSPPLLYVSGLARKEVVQRKVIPTKRWEGSEDLLKQAMKTSGTSYEKILLGIDIENGQTHVTIPKITGGFVYGRGLLYALRYFEWMQFLDATADPSDISKTVSNLGAYNALTGEKIWETGIDGYASNLGLGKNAVLVTARSRVAGIAGGQDSRKIPTRLIGISLQ